MKQHCLSKKTILTLGTRLFQCNVMLHLQSCCLLMRKNYALQSCPSWCAKVWPAFFVCYKNCWIPTSVFFFWDTLYKCFLAIKAEKKGLTFPSIKISPKNINRTILIYKTDEKLLRMFTEILQKSSQNFR